MSEIAITALPKRAKTAIRPMITDEPQPGKYKELSGVRLRRSGPNAVDLEMPNDEGEWFHWSVCREPGMTYGMTGLGQIMHVANVLATKAPNSEAARLVDKAAPRVAALSRYATTRVEDMEVVTLRLPVSLEDYTTVLLVPLPELSDVIDEPWLQTSHAVIVVGWALFGECKALTDRFFALTDKQQQRLLSGPATRLEHTLKRAGQVSEDVTQLLELANAGRAFRANR